MVKLKKNSGVVIMKKNEKMEITGAGRNPDNALIQKARPLQSLSQSKLTLAEFKLLDAYLARINSHDPERRTVTLEKGELEQYLGVSRILRHDLDNRLTNLFKSVNILDDKGKNNIHKIALFEEADAWQDENEQWHITLTCTQAARQYIFNIENLGYLQYRLKSIINLTSRYSYIMFLYLERNRHWHTWTATLDELRYELNCEADSYAAYKEFNDKVLKRCHKELHSKTDIRFEYSPIRTGRKVTSVQFTVMTQAELKSPTPEQEQIEGQLLLDTLSLDDEGAALQKYGNDRLAFIAGACDYEFTAEEMRVIFDKVLQIKPHNDALERYNYLLHKYHILKQAAAKTQIKHRYNYLLKLLDADIQ